MGDDLRVTQPVIPATVPGEAPFTKEEAEKLKAQIESALVEIQDARQYDEYAAMQDLADVEMFQAKFKALLPILDHFIKTGEWLEIPGGSGVEGNGLDPTAEAIKDLKPGWNGDVEVRKDLAPPAELRRLAELQGAEYAGTVLTQDSGDPTKEVKKVLQAEGDVTAFNFGKDVIYLEVYKENGRTKKRFWIGNDDTKNVHVKILVTAHNKQESGVKFDFHRVLRMSDGTNGIQYGVVGGIVFLGTDKNDDIIGTQGTDVIAGLKGHDTLGGEGGMDIIYGDDPWGEASTRIREALRLKTDLKDGDDTLDGGAGRDVLDGGFGFDYGVDSDPITGPNKETKLRIENTLESRKEDLDQDRWLGRHEGWEVQESRPGEVTLVENGDVMPSYLELKMPEGYNIMSAAQLGDGTHRYTLVKHTPGQAPTTFIINLKSFATSNRLNSLRAPTTIRIIGNGADNIIDLHEVDFGNNIFIGEGGGGNDMIMAPLTVLAKDGLTFNDLLAHPNRVSQADIERDYVGSLVEISEDEEDDDEEESDIRVAAGTREVVVSRRGNEDDTRPLHINSQDFDKAYVFKNPHDSDDMLVVLVQQGAEGSIRTLVVRIKDYEEFAGEGVNPDDFGRWLTIGPSASLGEPASGGEDGSDPEQHGRIPIIPLIYDEHNGTRFSGSFIDGEEGRDIVFHTEDDLVVHAESEVVGIYQPEEGPSRRAATGGDTPPPADPPADPPAPEPDPEAGSGEGGGGDDPPPAGE